MNQSIPSVSVSYSSTSASTKSNELGMRTMQERAYEKRGEQYLLIKSPPASGKSRALMFIALDKLNNQGIKKVIVVVPEKSIGSSFNDEPLSQYGFYWDWKVEPKWNLCNAPGEDIGKVDSVRAFLETNDQILISTHATIRNAVEKFGIQVFDDCLLAVDEFHHVSSNPDNKLGFHLSQFIARGKIHILAMTGSYFRGDAEAVLSPDDEAKFDTVTYTYYEQLNGYQYLKTLDIGYYFYSGSYIDEITQVLDSHLKTIVHIPNVNSRESTQRGKTTEVGEILHSLGSWKGKDDITGFDIVECPDGRVLKIADLVDDGPERHSKVLMALKDPKHKNDRDHVDIIIALGMAKEGFDWIWCEHALTIGYRSSLTEIIQIIGRATRDAKGKTHSKFTNLIAEPDASEEKVADAVNDTLKAIAASLLMEQVLTPKFNFTPKNQQSLPIDGFDYGENGYKPSENNVGFNEITGQFHVEIKGLVEPKSKDAQRICKEDLNEVITSFVQDKTTIERGLFDDELVPEELTQVRMGKIIRDRYPELDSEDQEAIRQHAIAALNMTQQAKKFVNENSNNEMEASGSNAFIQGVRKYAMDVRDLDIDLIDHINPFSEAYAILAKAMNEDSLKQVQAIIVGKRIKLTIEEAREYAKRGLRFKQERGRLPSLSAVDPWEKKMAEGIAFLAQMKAEELNG
jgi:superfamily II DNA or RNA helicase